MSEWRGTLADRVLRTREFCLPIWFQRDEYLDDIRHLMLAQIDVLREAEVFQVDNVAEYFYAVSDQENWRDEDFPCVAPPFNVMFLEFGRPSRINSSVNGIVAAEENCAARTGWLLTSSERADGEPGWDLTGTAMLELDAKDPLVKAGFAATGILWTGVYQGLVLNPDGSIEEQFDPGAVYPAAWLEEPGREEARRQAVSEFATAVSTTICPALLALTFANARNVRQETVSPPPRLVRRDTKLRRPPRFTYRTLDIGPVRAMIEGEGGLGEHGSFKKALHVCRGHFKTYTEDHPLYGKHVGTWWWAPQVRGRPDAGYADKDYRVREDAS